MKPIIIDIGSYAIKIGFGGEYAPRFDIPLVIGKIRDDIDFLLKKRIFKKLNIKDYKQEYFFGHNAIYLRNFLDINWISNGRTILDEFFFAKVFEYAIDLLKTTLTNRPIFITQPFYSDITNYVVKFLYSTYNAYEIIPVFQPLLNYLAWGLKTGLVVDIGHHITQITPMINGELMADGVRVVDIGGKDITNLLLNLLLENNAFDHLNKSTILSKQAISDTIKELYCYISRNPVKEIDLSKHKTTEITFPLLAGETIQIGVERFLAPEILFLRQKENAQPLDECLFEIISMYDPPYQKAFLRNILLTGGTSLLPGLVERLHEELVRKFNEYDYKIKIYSFAQYGSPRYSTFFGAAKLSTTGINNDLKIPRTDYEYKGKTVIPTTFIEQFSNIFDERVATKLKSINISVKNFYDKQLYQYLYDVINLQRKTSINELGDSFSRSPVEIYDVIETLCSYNIISGELDRQYFINSQYQEEEEGIPVQREVIKPEPTVQKASIEKEPYIPSFQRLEPEMPKQPTIQTSKRTKAPQYEPTFQKVDAEMQDKWNHDLTVLSGKQKSTPKTEVVEHAGGTFEWVDTTKAAEYTEDPSIITEKQTKVLRKQVQSTGYTFEKIDKELAEKWAKDDTIITEGKKPEPVDLLLPADDGQTFLRINKEMETEWKKTGLVLVPKRYVPKGFFYQPAAPTKDEELSEVPTFLQIKDEIPSKPNKTTLEELLQNKTIVETTTSTKPKIPSFLQFGGSDLNEEQLKQIKKFEEEERKKKEKEEKLL
ncbi:MAG: hypothetical protein ACFFD2_03625 [Promethearchaeota archaeon]